MAPSDMRDRPTAVYRLFDSADRLIYVGIAYDIDRRFSVHSATSPWWSLVSRSSIEWRPSRESAEAAELLAIKNEHPQYNRAGSDRKTSPARQFPIADEVSVAEARARFADVLNDAAVNARPIYVTMRGRRVAAFMPLSVLDDQS